MASTSSVKTPVYSGADLCRALEGYFAILPQFYPIFNFGVDEGKKFDHYFFHERKSRKDQTMVFTEN